MSPELFDKRLPPITPVRRGATPRRLSVPARMTAESEVKTRLSLGPMAHALITEESPVKAISPSPKKQKKRI